MYPPPTIHGLRRVQQQVQDGCANKIRISSHASDLAVHVDLDRRAGRIATEHDNRLVDEIPHIDL